MDIRNYRKKQKLNKDKVLFKVFNLNKKVINPVIIIKNDPKGCYILYWDNHCLLYKDVSILIRPFKKMLSMS